jgi:hypothetical protein
MPSKLRKWLFIPLLLALSLVLPRTSSAAPTPSITIFTPGEGSIVTSPIPISALLKPGSNGLIRITLSDKTGQILSRRLFRVPVDGDEEISLATQLLYEVPYPGVEGLLTLGTQDEFRRPLAERSVRLTLNADGETELQTNPAVEQWLTITSPEPGATLSGGAFTIEGTVTPFAEQPVRFELITDSGGQIGSVQLWFSDPGQPVPFALTIRYGFITTERDVRLVIRQTLPDTTVNLVLDSLPLTLAP